MYLDDDKSFRDIFSSPRSLKEQIIHIATNIHNRPSDADWRKYLAIKQHWAAPRCSAVPAQCGEQICGRCSTTLTKFDSWDAQTVGVTLSLVRPPRGEKPKYLAVSYCWSDSDTFRSESEPDRMSSAYCHMPVLIEQLDGTVRQSKAPCRILRRAIRHAAANRLKYIWIDQECIEQQDSEEKEHAIRAMDRVYRDAHTVLSLLDGWIADEFASVARKALEPPPPSADLAAAQARIFQFVRQSDLRDFLHAADALVHILNFVASDRWFTRAWILQERLCSLSDSGSDELWFMCSPGLPTTVPGELAVNATNFNLVMPQLFDALQHRNAALKTKLESAYLKFRNAYGLSFEMARRRVSSRVSGSLVNVNQAVSWLAEKGCLIPGDKVSIVANLCTWRGRVDPSLVKEEDISYSALLWALAIENGDASLFCQDPGCVTQERRNRMLWAPAEGTSLRGMTCPKATRGVPMRISEGGLETLGWLWKVVRIVDLNNPPITAELQVAGKEETLLELKTFFWELLRKLTAMRMHSLANLLWKALKYRGSAGIHGRHLVEVPNISFDQILDPDTGRYAATYQRLGFKDRETYMACADDSDNYYAFYHRFCPKDKDEIMHRDCDIAQEDNFDVFFGDHAQLLGLYWIRTAVQKFGGLSIGCLVDANDDFHDKDKGALILTDGSIHPYVFTQFRHVIKRFHGKDIEKRLVTWSPFDVWRADRENHSDAPFSWEAFRRRRESIGGGGSSSSDSSGVTAMAPCNVLFDIATIPYQEHTLDWPEEFDRDEWTSGPSEQMERLNVATADRGKDCGPDWFGEALGRVVSVGIEKVELKKSASPTSWQLLRDNDSGSYAASEMQWQAQIRR